MDRILLHVRYTCRPGKAEAFVAALKDSGLQSAVRAEDGCLQYDYHISCEEADTVVLIELWRDAAALAAHQNQPHMGRLPALKEPYVTATSVERFE